MIRILYMTIAYFTTYLVLENLNKRYCIINKLNSNIKSRFKIANKNGFYLISTVLITVLIYIIISSFIDIPKEIMSVIQGITISTAIMLDSVDLAK